ncbi:hypothetical protein [Mesorhizobium sp. ESP-6-2]|uniref:hypothetical protein n=1 Tax=Mesorhizobium sp. ESP-6-2 TaxID=2876625 RepID=UPI001CCAC1CE|nr:hypothetical protein [Mesorhizobium sp. ESP-6-2]MBZ9808113.1 hypothetical protein [Mesorhizobium sp. ESP-6-2]
MAGEPRRWQTEKLRLEREPPQHDDILRSIGEIVIAWNGVEASIRLILEFLCGPSAVTQVMTAELTAEQLSNSLRAVGKIAAPDEINDNIEFICVAMNEQRPYRNDYLHGIVYSAPGTEGLGAQIKNKSSRSGQLRLHDQVIDAYEMFLTKEAMILLSGHALEVYSWLWLHRNKGTLSTLPQRPTFPKLHSRRLRNWPPRPPMPLPSQELR